MQQAIPAAPRLSITFAIPYEVYRDCLRMLGERMKRRSMPRMVVLGIFFAACAVGSLCYLHLYLHQSDLFLSVVIALLLLLGAYNLLYYPLLFDRLMEGRARRLYKKRRDYLEKPVTLHFYDEYFEEVTIHRRNRVQWTAVLALHREKTFLLLRLTPNSGVIIPRAGVDPERMEAVEAFADQACKDAKSGTRYPA